ncbi:hypothetical protein LCGC14_0220640 [marine sediment metagenome]|uniref:Uncharacterized protein n=1 Tax=marine sediment metagenome TaxID=412755 RepID=A0A0F9WXN3_9ZZZZ
MEKHTNEPEVTVGETVFVLTKDEVTEAVFVFAVGREPTGGEMKRLNFYVCERRGQSEQPWRLELCFKDHPPTIVPNKGVQP